MATTVVADSALPSNRPRLDHELDLVRGAIDLIVGGGASRVTLVGMTSAERLLPRAQSLSSEAGLAARAIWHPDGGGCDIAVERVR